MSKKKKLTLGILGKFFKGLFSNLDIDKNIANHVLKDPNVQRLMKQVQKSMDKIAAAADYFKRSLLNDDNIY